ncbi:MAG: HAD family phosphatase [Bacteroidetes bacterium]|nr:HAD family phosphatase [Bacteroidota bacterium]
MTTVIYDLEGIIIDTEGIWDISHNLFLDKLGVNSYDRDYKKELAGKTLWEGTEIIRLLYSLNITTSELIGLRKSSFVETISSFEVSLIKGFLDVNDKISNLNLKACIATSMDKDLFDQLSLSGFLYDLFLNKVFFTSSERLKSKPAPDIFLYALREMNAKSSNALVIEDSPIGIKAAKAAGIKCIGISNTFDKKLLQDADFVYDSFNQIDLDLVINVK